VPLPRQHLALLGGFINPLPNEVRGDYSGDGVEAPSECSCVRLWTSDVDIVYVTTKADLTLATAALNFAIGHPQSTSTLIGTAKASTLMRNLGAFN